MDSSLMVKLESLRYEVTNPYVSLSRLISPATNVVSLSFSSPTSGAHFSIHFLQHLQLGIIFGDSAEREHHHPGRAARQTIPQCLFEFIRAHLGSLRIAPSLHAR